MSKTSTYTVQFKRRRTQKTNYKKRLAMLKSKMPRLVIRKTNRTMLAQIVSFDPKGDKTMCTASSKDLVKLGWKHSGSSITAAYFTGFLCASKAKKQGTTDAILDIGLYSPIHGSKVFACLKGAIDAGLKVPAEETVFPSQERIKGTHLKNKLSAQEFEQMVKQIHK